MDFLVGKAEFHDWPQIKQLWVELTDHVNSLDPRHWQRAEDGSAKFRQWME